MGWWAGRRLDAPEAAAREAAARPARPARQRPPVLPGQQRQAIASDSVGLSGLGLDYTPQMEDLANGSGLSRMRCTWHASNVVRGTRNWMNVT